MIEFNNVDCACIKILLGLSNNITESDSILTEYFKLDNEDKEDYDLKLSLLKNSLDFKFPNIENVDSKTNYEEILKLMINNFI